jgi:hypothetical protein
MSRDSNEFPGGSRGPSRPRPPGAQGASRGGFRPDESDGNPDPQGYQERAGSRSSTDGDAPFGGYPFGNQNQQSRSRKSSFFSGGPRFLGLPVNLIYTLGAALIGLIFIGAVCGRPATTGSVAGQVKGLNADNSIATLAGAQLVLRGSGGQTVSTTSTDVPADATGEAAYNYRFENVPTGTYSMAVTPPAGSTFQPEQDISFKVEGGQLFPQSVMLLAQGIQKPRQLAANELQPGEAGGYVNGQGQRVVYQNNGFDSSDALLMYLLWRNPPGWGYGAPPVIYAPSGSNTGYRVADPPSSSRSGQTVTQQRPQTAGQGATRPSGSTGVTGAGPNTSSGSSSRPPDAVAPSQSNPSTGSSGSSGANTSTQTRPSTAPSTGSQGASRPSTSTSRPSSSSAPSRSSGSSGGGRR